MPVLLPLSVLTWVVVGLLGHVGLFLAFGSTAVLFCTVAVWLAFTTCLGAALPLYLHLFISPPDDSIVIEVSQCLTKILIYISLYVSSALMEISGLRTRGPVQCCGSAVVHPERRSHASGL
jgi:hypothetical protein